MNPKEILERQTEKGNKLRSIVQSGEWVEIENILKKEWLSAFETLIDHEDEVARATMKAIDALYCGITNGLRIADKAREQLLKKFK